jgi:hypothetical protein
MANEEMVKSLELRRSLDLLDETAIELFEINEALGMLMAALEDIIDVPNRSASDARAVKEMVRLATAAISFIEELK